MFLHSQRRQWSSLLCHTVQLCHKMSHCSLLTCTTTWQRSAWLSEPHRCQQCARQAVSVSRRQAALSPCTADDAHETRLWQCSKMTRHPLLTQSTTDTRPRGWLEFNVPFQQKYGYIRYKRSGVESYPLTQWRKASDILTSTLATFLFSSHPKRERDWEAHYGPLCKIGQVIIFLPCGFFFPSSIFFFPR